MVRRRPPSRRWALRPCRLFRPAARSRKGRSPRPSPWSPSWSRRRRRSPRSRRVAAWRASESRQRRSSSRRLWLAMTTLRSGVGGRRRDRPGTSATLARWTGGWRRRPGGSGSSRIAPSKIFGCVESPCGGPPRRPPPAAAPTPPGCGGGGRTRGRAGPGRGGASRSPSSSAVAAAIASLLSAIARGGSGSRLVKPSAPRAVVTTAFWRAIASSTFIRIPPPLRTGASTTAAASR